MVGKNQERNELIVSQYESKLLATELNATNVSWISGSAPAKNFKCGARIRYRSEIVPCTISCHPEECNEEGSSKDSSPAVRVQFKTPVRAITPGQSSAALLFLAALSLMSAALAPFAAALAISSAED